MDSMTTRLVCGSIAVIAAVVVAWAWARAHRAREQRMAEERREGIDLGKHVEL